MNADVWSLSDDRSWIWERFEDAWFLFNPLSNETHVLNAATVALLDLLRGRALPLTEIAACLGREGDREEDVIRSYRILLAELDRLGLIVPAWP